MDVKNRKRILLAAPNWLGDILFLTPTIRAVRKAYPGSFLACWVAPRGEELLRNNPHLDAVIPWEEPRGTPGLFQWGPLIRRLRSHRFDTVFLFHRSLSRTLASWISGISSRIGYRTWKRGWLLTLSVDPPPGDFLPKSETFLRLAEAAGVPRDGDGYDFRLVAEDREETQQLLTQWGIGLGERFVALHTGANWKLKRWSAHSFCLLADALVQRYSARIVFVGGKGDLPLVQKIAGRMISPAVVATGKTTLRQLGALLARASLLISNDSGPLHLGCAVGTPVVALFGPTSPALTGPPAGAKAATLFGSIGCPVPCYQLNCPVNLCMEQITVEQVLEAASQFLKGSDPF